MKIFISYRRDDGGHAGRLQARLAREFGEDAVFFDLNTIEPGERFADKIREAAASSHVLLAVIGPRWLAPEADGKRRLDDPEDYVRAEIASALKQGVRVIPVLVQDAPVPRAEDLPDDLKLLAGLNAFELSNERWEYDAQCLISSLKPKRGKSFLTPGRAAWLLIPATALALLLVLILPRYLSPETDGNADGNADASNVPTPRPVTPTPTPTPQQEEALLTTPAECFRQFLPKDRWISIVYGDPAYHPVLRQDQPKGGVAGILFTEEGQQIGAIRFKFTLTGKDGRGQDTGFFKIDKVVGPPPACHPVEDYSNISRGGPKDTLDNFDHLDLSLAGRHYNLRLGYQHDNIVALFRKKVD